MPSRVSIHTSSYLVREFYRREALSPASTISLSELPHPLRMALRRLLQRQVVQEVRPGYYYLDGPAFERYWGARAKAIGVFLVLVLVLLAARLLWG